MTETIHRRFLKCERGVAALEFVILAPVLLTLIFSIFVYSLYFTALIGVRQAAAEGARAAVAGLSASERATLAQTRAQSVITSYGVMLSGAKIVAAAASSPADTFLVTVTYDMKNAPIMRYGGFVPLPTNKTVSASVTVTNGGY
jgi:Flp pilus assembly protein TadG